MSLKKMAVTMVVKEVLFAWCPAQVLARITSVPLHSMDQFLLF
jgi:hypothetical protein